MARARFVAREFRRVDPRNVVFAAAPSSITARTIPVPVVKDKKKINFSLDVSNGFCHMYCHDHCTVDPRRDGWATGWMNGYT